MCAVTVKKDALYCWNCKSDQSKCRPSETQGNWHAERPLSRQSMPPSTHFGRPVEKVKSFEEFVKEKKSTSQTRFDRKNGKRKRVAEDVTINIGLKKIADGDLKTIWGKRLPITVAKTAAHFQVLEKAVAKWAAFDRNFDSEKDYVLLYEDGSSALFMPGEKKEFFELQKYKDALGKDYKRITLFLCLSQHYYEAEGITSTEKTDDTELTETDLFDSNLCNMSNVEGDMAESSATLPLEADIIAIADEIYARELQNQVHHSPSQEMKTGEVEITSVRDILKILQERVNKSQQFFITTRRQVPISRILQLWQRQEKKSSVAGVLVVKYAGEDGIDQGALGKEFMADTLSDMAEQFFPAGSPVNSTLHVQNGNFETCGKIVAVSLSQGGPFPCFLEKCVYESMFKDYNMQELKDDDLTEAEQKIIEAVKEDPQANTDIILDSNYTGIITQDNIHDICNSLKVSFISRRCLYMKEFSKGLESYSIMQLVHQYPDICEEIFVSKHAYNTIPDADYLYSLLMPQFAEKGSNKREIEEKMMDIFQDFLFKVEDELIAPQTSIAAWDHPIEDTEKPEEHVHQSVVTIPRLLGWFTGQRHKSHGPWQNLSTKVIFDHECKSHNPLHTVCYPVIHACSREVTFPVEHMSTADKFELIFMTGFTHGYSFAVH